MHQAQYAEFRKALDAAGYTATVDVGAEYRSAELQAAADIAIHVGEILAADGLIRLADLIRRHLRGLRRPSNGARRQAVIYGPRGEVLSRIDIDETDDQAP
jgi:hypothetical protein